MSKALKITGLIIGIVVALILAAAIALPLFFDPNDFKQEITDLVKDKTGRELTIGGDIELSVFPWLGVELGALELSNAKGFGAEPFAKIGAAHIRVKLMPLLHKGVEMDTVSLRALSLNLVRNKAGQTNWADLAGAAPKEKEKKPEQREEGQMLAALAIGGLDVADSRIVWDDRMSGARYRIDNLSLRTGPLALGGPMDVALKFDLDSKQPAINGQVGFDGKVTLDVATQSYALDKAKLAMQLKGDDLPQGTLDLTLAADVAANLAQQTARISGLKLDTLGLTLDGDLKGSAILNDPRISGTLKVREFSPRALIERLGQEPVQTADGNALATAALTTELEASTRDFKLNKLSAKLDDTSLEGTLTVRDFAKPAIGFEVDVDEIDLDRYLPPAAAGADKKATPASGAAAGAGQLPLDTLRALDLNGTLRIGKMKASNIRSQDIHLTVAAKDGLVKLHPLSADMYGGKYRGDVRLDARGKNPRYSLNESLTGVQASPLLKDYMGKDTLAGTANVSAALTAQGDDPLEVRRSLNGRAAFSFTDGAIKGVNVAKLIREAYARYKGQPAPADTGPDQTDFTELTGTATVTDGLADNRDLSLKSPLLRVAGAGTANLVSEDIDYVVKTSVVGSLEGQGGKAIDELKGVTIPIKIAGKFAAPSFSLDLDALLKEKAKAQVKKKIEEKKEDLQDKVGDKLKGRLKGLLGR